MNLNFKQEDFGILLQDNGDIYIGEIQDTVPNGLGVILFFQGDSLLGEFYSTEIEGYFKYWSKNKSIILKIDKEKIQVVDTLPDNRLSEWMSQQKKYNEMISLFEYFQYQNKDIDICVNQEKISVFKLQKDQKFELKINFLKNDYQMTVNSNQEYGVRKKGGKVVLGTKLQKEIEFEIDNKRVMMMEEISKSEEQIFFFNAYVQIFHNRIHQNQYLQDDILSVIKNRIQFQNQQINKNIDVIKRSPQKKTSFIKMPDSQETMSGQIKQGMELFKSLVITPYQQKDVQKVDEKITENLKVIQEILRDCPALKEQENQSFKTMSEIFTHQNQIKFYSMKNLRDYPEPQFSIESKKDSQKTQLLSNVTFKQDKQRELVDQFVKISSQFSINKFYLLKNFLECDDSTKVQILQTLVMIIMKEYCKEIPNRKVYYNIKSIYWKKIKENFKMTNEVGLVMTSDGYMHQIDKDQLSELLKNCLVFIRKNGKGIYKKNFQRIFYLLKGYQQTGEEIHLKLLQEIITEEEINLLLEKIFIKESPKKQSQEKRKKISQSSEKKTCSISSPYFKQESQKFSKQSSEMQELTYIDSQKFSSSKKIQSPENNFQKIKSEKFLVKESVLKNEDKFFTVIKNEKKENFKKKLFQEDLQTISHNLIIASKNLKTIFKNKKNQKNKENQGDTKNKRQLSFQKENIVKVRKNLSLNQMHKKLFSSSKYFQALQKVSKKKPTVVDLNCFDMAFQTKGFKMQKKKSLKLVKMRNQLIFPLI